MQKKFILQTEHHREGLERFYYRRTTYWLSIPERCFHGSNTTGTEQKGLAVVDACKLFLPYLIGRPFFIQTAHCALAFLNSKDTTSRRLARWIDVLPQLDYTIIYRQGKANVDAFSRQTIDFPTEKDGGDVRSTQQELPS